MSAAVRAQVPGPLPALVGEALTRELEARGRAEYSAATVAGADFYATGRRIPGHLGLWYVSGGDAAAIAYVVDDSERVAHAVLSELDPLVAATAASEVIALPDYDDGDLD